ncbi:uncharacterized protein LOC135848006 [Planococcus citri]|uniref:uncharacterized protein LOC135848006 n=1 Tax=Planococcus citri TaxID=170843 RepID=UPI0031F82CFC
MNWTCLLFCAVCVLVQFGNSAADSYTNCKECTELSRTSDRVNVTMEQAAGDHKVLVTCYMESGPTLYPKSHNVTYQNGTKNRGRLNMRFEILQLGIDIIFSGVIQNNTDSFNGTLRSCDGEVLIYTATVVRYFDSNGKRYYLVYACGIIVTNSGKRVQFETYQLISPDGFLKGLDCKTKTEIEDAFDKLKCYLVVYTPDNSSNSNENP